MDLKLSGKVALVSGSTGGIGLAIASFGNQEVSRRKDQYSIITFTQKRQL